MSFTNDHLILVRACIGMKFVENEKLKWLTRSLKMEKAISHNPLTDKNQVDT